MKAPKRTTLLLMLVLVFAMFTAFRVQHEGHDRINFHIVDPAKELISMHWKNGSGAIHGNIGTLEKAIDKDGKVLRFAMNGGMYMKDFSPVGLYVEDGRLLHPIDRRIGGTDNFHMQPNGVFGIAMDRSAFVRTTTEFKDLVNVRYATQSGPMLVANGIINAHFTKGSRNVHIRNGVGIMADGRVLFAISNEPLNLYDFALFFIDKGCANALYLDGFVSKAYIPAQGIAQLDGQLGVLIAVVGSK